MVELRNYMEICTKELMPAILKQLGCCDCTVCQMDILAIVLNKLPPKYIVTNKGQLYAKMSFLRHQFEVDIISAITYAAQVVTANPRH